MAWSLSFLFDFICEDLIIMLYGAGAGGLFPPYDKHRKGAVHDEDEADL